jgi:hypothetical protein
MGVCHFGSRMAIKAGQTWMRKAFSRVAAIRRGGPFVSATVTKAEQATDRMR